MNVSRSLFTDIKDVKLGGAADLKVGMASKNPASLATNHGKSDTRQQAKLSAVANAMDTLIFDKSAVVYEMGNTVVSAFKYDGELFVAKTDGESIWWTNKKPIGSAALYPLFYWSLRAEAENDEYKEMAGKLAGDFKKAGVAVDTDLYRICDTFYYEWRECGKNDNVDMYETALAIEEVKQSYASGGLNEIVIENLEMPNLLGFKKREKKATSATGKSLFNACKEGKFLVKYDSWDEDQKSRIPLIETLDDFIPSEQFEKLLKKVVYRTTSILERMNAGEENPIGKDYINSFIVGKPGTGKTTAAYALGAATGMPVYTVPIQKNTEEDTFQGMTKVIKGALKFVPTDFLNAYKNGGIIVLEEINLADPAVIMGALGQAVEFPFTLMEDGYNPVHRHPLCIIIGTMNIGTNGSKGVSQALSSRFKQTYRLEDPKKADFLSILEKNGASANTAKWLYNAYDKINQYLKQPNVNAEEVCLYVTMRGCIGAIECMAEGASPKDAVLDSLVGKIAEVDLQLAQDVEDAVVKTLPDLLGV